MVCQRWLKLIFDGVVPGVFGARRTIHRDVDIRRNQAFQETAREPVAATEYALVQSAGAPGGRWDPFPIDQDLLRDSLHRRDLRPGLFVAARDALAGLLSTVGRDSVI